MSDPNWRFMLFTHAFLSVASLITVLSVVGLLTRPEELPPAPQRVPTR